MQIQIKSKRTVAIIAVVAALLIVLAGAFAWNSLNQQRINVFRELIVPGVNLHDDFDDPNKDVYVENSGDVRVIVRVRLTEYLQTAMRGSLVNGHERYGADETDNARLNWTPHSGIGGVTECCADEYHVLGENWPSGDWFHEYYEWTMGGQKYYMPVKSQLTQDANGDYYDSDGNLVDIDDYICADNTEYDGTEENVKQTLPADVITMADWLADGRKQGEFWVVDTDGWCYWAQQLPPDTATGLLLDSVTRTDRVFDSSAEYCINAWLQAVDEVDIDLFRIAENGGITNDAMVLVQILAEKILLADDGAIYENNYNGTYTQMADNDGNTLENPRTFIPLGEFTDSYEIINADPDNRLYVGDKFNLTALVWDGEGFTNYDTLNTNAPWYNLAVSDTGAYTAEGTETGTDGVVYLIISDGAGNSFYLTSVKRNETQTFAVEPAYTYKQSRPGTAPFGLIYQGGEQIGTKDDTYYDRNSYTERYFTHIGSGVYIEAAAQGDTESKDDPIVYYFAGMILNDADTTLNTLKYPTEASQNARIDYLFPFSIAVDDGFSLAVDANGDLTGLIKTDDGDYTMVPLVEGTDGSLYIELDDGQYIGPGEDGMLGGSAEEGGGFGGSTIVEVPDGGTPGGETTVVLAQPKPPGTGTPQDPYRIRSRADMDWLSRQVNLANKSFAGEFLLVVNDIDMGSTAFTPIGTWTNATTNKPFLGTFDGGGYTISGLKVEGGNYSGFFRFVGTSGEVENVVLDNVLIDGGSTSGSVAGRSEGIISNCRVLSGKVYGTTYTGGIVGLQSGGSIENCENETDVTSKSTATNGRVGGIVGGLSNADVTGCTNKGSVAGDKLYVGGIAGSVTRTTGNSVSVTNCVNAGDVNGTGSVGGIAGANGIDATNLGGTIGNCANTGDVYGTGGAVGGVVGSNNGTVQTSYNSTGKVESTSTSVGGVVGNNNTGAFVTNCYAWSNVKGTFYIGGVAGYNYGTINYSYHAIGTITASHASDGNVGGIIGRLSPAGKVENSVALAGALSGYGTTRYKTVGVAESGGTYSNLYAYSGMTLNGAAWGGGLRTGDTGIDTQTPDPAFWANTVSFDFGTVWKWDTDNNLPNFTGIKPDIQDGSPAFPFLIKTRADMNALSTAVQNGTGGLAGQIYKVANNIDMGGTEFTPIGVNTSGKQFLGIFDGGGYTISNLKIDRSGTDYVGLFGYIGNGSTVKNVNLVNADINGKDYVGGIAGYSDGGAISMCGNSGNVTGSGNYIGGIVGRSYIGTVTNCYNTGSVSGNISSSGIVGGIAGQAFSGHIKFAYHAAGAVSGNSNVGGIAGRIEGTSTVENCGVYNANVSGVTSWVNKIVGYSSGSTCSKCYYYNVTGGTGGSHGGTELAITKANFVSGSYLNFSDTIWEWRNGDDQLPVLIGATP